LSFFYLCPTLSLNNFGILETLSFSWFKWFRKPHQKQNTCNKSLPQICEKTWKFSNQWKAFFSNNSLIWFLKITGAKSVNMYHHFRKTNITSA
jgi:hypothetical protein